MTDHEQHTGRSAEDHVEDKAVQSIPLDTEDGGSVVIEQQNMGGSRQVGGGEYKNVGSGKSVEQAGAEQAALEREAPIHDASSEDAKQSPAAAGAGLDPDAPGVSVLGLQQAQPVENNEPA